MPNPPTTEAGRVAAPPPLCEDSRLWRVVDLVATFLGVAALTVLLAWVVLAGMVGVGAGRDAQDLAVGGLLLAVTLGAMVRGRR